MEWKHCQRKVLTSKLFVHYTCLYQFHFFCSFGQYRSLCHLHMSLFIEMLTQLFSVQILYTVADLSDKMRARLRQAACTIDLRYTSRFVQVQTRTKYSSSFQNTSLAALNIPDLSYYDAYCGIVNWERLGDKLTSFRLQGNQ